MNKIRCRGVSLVDLMIGVTLLVIIMLGAFLSLKSLGQGQGSMSINSRVSNKIGAVKEQLRYEAATDRYNTWDTSPTTDWTTSFDPEIRVTSTVGPENVATRARPVTITATWRTITGETRTKDQKFYLNRVRAESAGATVAIRVVKDGFETEGIADVLVWAKGKNGMVPPLGARTDASGNVVISDVMIGANIPVWVDGQLAKAYFHHQEWGQRRWRRDESYPTGPFLLNHTSLAETNRELTSTGSQGPIRMKFPGALVGTVYDLSEDTLVPAPAGLRVRAILKGNADIAWTPAEVDVTTETTNAGTYAITRLVPGHYFPLHMGNAAWAATARPNDEYMIANNGDVLRVNSNQTVVKNFVTGRKGDLTATVKKISFNPVTGNYELAGNAPANVNLRYVRNVVLGYHDPLKEEPNNFLYNNTTIWFRYLASLYNNNAELVTTTSGGNHTASRFGPQIVNSGTGTWTMSGQYMLVQVEPAGTEFPNPMTPIRVAAPVFPATPAQVKFLMVNSSNGRIVAPAGTSPDVFRDVKLKVNSTVNKEIYLADRSILARVSGVAVLDEGNNQDDLSEPPFNETPSFTITAYFGAGAFGGVQFSGGNPNRASLKSYSFSNGAGGTWDSNYHGSMRENLPPNLGAETTRLVFEAGLKTTSPRTFTGNVVGKKKFLDENDNVVYVDLPADEVDATMKIRGYVYNPNGPNVGRRGAEKWSENNVQILNGRLGASGTGFSRLIEKWDAWWGQKTVHLDPGWPEATQQNLRLLVRHTTIGNFQNQFVLAFDGISSDGKWAPNRFPTEPYGPVYACPLEGTTFSRDVQYAWNTYDLSLIRRIYVHVFGTVRALGGNQPIPGAVVELQDCSGNSWSATSNATGNYDFPARYVSADEGWNVKVRVVSAPVIGNQSYHPTLFEERVLVDTGSVVNWQKDFTLTSSEVGDGGGGSDGGEGN